MAAQPRHPGFLQGILLLLPITLAVMGISVLAPVVPLLLRQFASVPYHEYLVMGGILTMPAIWVLLFSPVAGLMADRFGRRNRLAGRRGRLRIDRHDRVDDFDQRLLRRSCP